MARISGLEKSQALWHLRWFYRVMRKMFGKDLTPVKVQMRVPGLVWGSVPAQPIIADTYNYRIHNWKLPGFDCCCRRCRYLRCGRPIRQTSLRDL